MSVHKGKGKRQAAPKKPIQPAQPKATTKWPVLGAVLLLIGGCLLWLLTNSIGHQMTNDNIRGVARVVKNPICLNKYTWDPTICPNKQPGDYVPAGNFIGIIIFAIAAGLAFFLILRATRR